MGRQLLIAALCGAAVVSLGACAGLGDLGGREGATSVTFRCDDDREFLALFSEDRQRSFVKTEDETYELVLVDRDGDEAEYANGDGVRLTIDGDDSRLRVPGEEDFEDCDT